MAVVAEGEAAGDRRGDQVDRAADIQAGQALRDGILGQAMEPVAPTFRGLEHPVADWIVEGAGDREPRAINSLPLRAEDLEHHNDDLQASSIRSAGAEMANGNYTGARSAFANVAGGGRRQDATSGKIEYKPFAPPKGKDWHAWFDRVRKLKPHDVLRR